MPKKGKLFAAGLFLTLIGIACVALVPANAKAEETNHEQSGDGWSITASGVMTIESDQGWANCLKDGFEDNVRELIIGKDVTNFRMYDLPYDVPTENFFGPKDIIGYSSLGNPIYDFKEIEGLFPSDIVVEDGNSVFRVIDGLLINTETQELVLSEMGVKDVVIPDVVKKITKDAFYDRNLKTVKFPCSLQSIGNYAFAKCENLTSVDLPDSLTQLEEGAFAFCSALENVRLSQKLEMIGMHAFHACPISTIEIPSSVSEIGGWAFFDCKELQRISLSIGVKTIGQSAFCNCKQLKSINFPEGLESIGEQAFCGCDSLKQVILTDSLQLIANKAFWGCKLTVLRIPEKLTFLVNDQHDWKFIVNPHTKEDKTFGLSSAETVILSGSDYDFGYPAISHAHNVYFLGKPPEDVGQILDENSVESIFCSDEFEFEWTRSTVASWVRQRLTILPADQMKQITEQELNATPLPTDLPRPTPRPTETPWPTPMPRPTASPAMAAKPQQQPADPLVFAFAGILALLIAGIIVVAVKSKPNNRKRRRKHA